MLIKKIQTVHQIRKQYYPVLRAASFLVNGGGFYYFDNNKLIRITKTLIKQYGIVRTIMFTFYLKKRKKTTEYFNGCSTDELFFLNYGFGWSKKIVVARGSLVFSIYKHPNSQKWLSNMKRYLQKLAYDYPDHFVIDEKNRLVVSSYVKHKSVPIDSELLHNIATYVFSKNSLSEKMLNFDYRKREKYNKLVNGDENILSYVQHGDLTTENILNTGSDFVICDLDSINVYPALHDFFALCRLNPILIKAFYNGDFDKEIGKLFLSTPDEFLGINAIKDKYLSIFIQTSPWDSTTFIVDLPPYYNRTKKLLTI